MANSTFNKARCITAYAVGSLLTFFCVMWFLVQYGTQIKRGTGMAFSSHFSGYALAVLFAAGGALTCLAALRRMPDSVARKVRRLTAYVFGSVLICLGVMGLLIELGKGMPSSSHFSGYVASVVLVVCGVGICIAVRCQYGGGFWSLLGLLLAALGTGRLLCLWLLTLHGRGRHAPVDFDFGTAALFAIGCYCLAWGHFRRHKGRKGYLNETG
jgi:hypothetical protein